MDIENDAEAEKYLISANVSKSDLPLVILKDGSFVNDPSLPDLAERVGLQQKATKEMYDVLIIGAGPAGLAASVYGSCEGLKTLLIERSNPGGQASSSARIENYLGFPNGLSGAELSRRAITQTLRFGTEILTPQEVKNITVKDGYKITEMKDGSEIHSKAIVIATGVAYKKLEISGLEEFYRRRSLLWRCICRGARLPQRSYLHCGRRKFSLPGSHVYEQICQRSKHSYQA